MVRILVLTPYFPPEGGGLERYALSMVRELGNEHEVRVLTMSRERGGVETLPSGITVERIKARFILSNTPISLRFLMRVLSTVRSWRPELIVAHTPVPYAADVAALLSRLFRIPLLVVYHTVGLTKGSSLDFLARLYSRTLERFTLSSASRLVSVSSAVWNYLFSRGFHSMVVFPPVDSKLVELAFSSGSDVCRNKEKAVLFVGQLSSFHSFKNFDVLLETFASISPLHPEWKLWVAGGGDLLDYYIELARRMGLEGRVRFFGRVDGPEELAEIYSRASVVVLPSSFESFGMAVLEGMLFGDVPVVSDVVASNFRKHPLGAMRFLYVVRQKTELPSMLNELLSSPKILKKGCLFLQQAKKAKKGPVHSGFGRLPLHVDLLEKFRR